MHSPHQTPHPALEDNSCHTKKTASNALSPHHSNMSVDDQLHTLGVLWDRKRSCFSISEKELGAHCGTHLLHCLRYSCHAQKRQTCSMSHCSILTNFRYATIRAKTCQVKNTGLTDVANRDLTMPHVRRSGDQWRQRSSGNHDNLRPSPIFNNRLLRAEVSDRSGSPRSATRISSDAPCNSETTIF